MKQEEFIPYVKDIVSDAYRLAQKHIENFDFQVNYACIFTHHEKEYEDLLRLAAEFGNMCKETPTGILYHILELGTIAGSLRLLKIRKPDPTRFERGDADFTMSNFENFKQKYLGLPGFLLIDRGHFEMIELLDEDFDVRAYFSNPPLDKQLGITQSKS